MAQWERTLSMTEVEEEVLVNQSAMDNPIVQSALAEMSKRNFEPQSINRYGVWYISDRH